jgi:hypothetical protein
MGAGAVLASSLATRWPLTTLVRVVSASGEVQPGRHVCFHREAHAMERMCAAARGCGRSLVDRPRRLSGGHRQFQIVRGGRSQP